MPHKVKITVLRREYDQKPADPTVGPCQIFQDGREFLVDDRNYFTMLDGKFCTEA